ncbi:carbohydrate ABC transporter permease [Paenibacillus macquariensis]|uniref:Carbohydrate ABC transporter membrane protein 2, CUT1 family n=1 Tax=Paenibacillus macquariensis TaxID=948756 RepID=A0ABY1KC48_9BACL|nr:carbohydrate ABC transporter permease [Paenibacillus macquariensis]MEC0089613.1 carbohydrate ABC transporter permease [Paenibacillus macquariensis]OAB30896.1 sugar ABC transporter permease [Paenibacillus macquariensis subsp. macquariensis]SIR58398.1 carbohydrate ABC transporter membrane protein 2, CUT1 family [Paenibacillus macquariensis]
MSFRRTLPQILIHLLLILFGISCIIPLISIISISLSDENSIIQNGYSFVPQGFNFSSYAYVLYKPLQLLSALKTSLIVSIVGTLISLIITAGIAYVLSREDYKYKSSLSFYVFFTMLFNGGLVPTYMLISKYLHLKNTIWVLILPYLAIPWFILLLRSFMQKIPHSIIESCMIDGASELRIFFKIILPLAKPGLATIGLFIVLQYWNDWWLSLLYIEKESLVPLQYMLYRMINNIEFLTSSTNAMPPGMNTSIIPAETARMAMAILAAGPMLVVFPFFQKYFVKGLTVGAVKG